MPTLPIPAFAALVLAFLGLRAWARGETPVPLLVLIGGLALQSAVVAGSQHYALPGFAAVQPVLALCLPPLAWVAFVMTVRRPFAAADLWHVTIPAFGAFAWVFALWWVLDLWIVGVFLAYGGAILWSLRRGRRSGACPAGSWREALATLALDRGGADRLGSGGRGHPGSTGTRARSLGGLVAHRVVQRHPPRDRCAGAVTEP